MCQVDETPVALYVGMCYHDWSLYFTETGGSVHEDDAVHWGVSALCVAVCFLLSEGISGNSGDCHGHCSGVRNASVLPERVGLFLSTEGTFSLLVSRQQAVFGPLLVTGLSLIFMAASRKVFYPWLISVITLVLPFLIQLLNQFGF